MTTQTTFPDYMPDIRAFLRGHPYLADLSAGRVFFRLPPKISAAPFLRIYDAGTVDQEPSDAPAFDAGIGIDVWGMAGSDYTAIRQTQLALFAIGHDTPALTVLGPGGTVALNIHMNTALDSPDPETGWPRKVVHSIWSVRVG